MQNKNMLIIAVVVLVLALGAGYYFMQGNRTVKQAEQAQNEYMEEEEIPSIDPEEIGLEFTARSDKKYVKFIINNPKGITHVEYDIAYEALTEGNVVNQGLTGEVKESDFKSDRIEIDWRELGTCSTGGKCRFDQGVKEVTLILKVTKDKKVYQATKSLTL